MVQTIKKISQDRWYGLVDDAEDWSFTDEMIDHEATTKLNEPTPKSLLKSGMVVEYNNGERALVLVGDLPTELYGIQKFVFLNRDSDGFMNGSGYDDNLISTFGYYNVNRIYKPNVCSLNISNHCNESNLIWQRPAPQLEPKVIKMTLTEVATKLGLDENTKIEIEG